MGIRNRLETLLEDKRVLVVGAGGIGCELLKNLVLTGFKKIHVVDLDTIDVSNLNRQFLFRREHVNKSKAEVASAAVQKLQPNVNITFDHDSIFNGDKFGISFFKEFNLVMNALDNRSARNHVNRLCLSAGVPLIESGSAGYIGQVSVIIKGQTQCYECTSKPAPKTYPGCTIRNTPSEHIHCTVWSKHCFNQLFGEVAIDDDVSPDLNDPENKTAEEATETMMNGNGHTAMEEGNTNGFHTNGVAAEESNKNTVVPSTRKWAEESGYNAKLIFDKLFHDDIEYLLTMKDLWKSRKPPTPITFANVTDEAQGGGSTEMTDDVNDIMKQWTLKACARVFVESVDALKTRKSGLPEGQLLSWDKDDDDAMRFVAAVANLRAHIFSIPGKSLFEIKSMAGNIIPAIATTNAIVAGMVVVEAIKVLRGRKDLIRTVYINRQPNPRGQLLMDDDPYPPRKECFVCSSDKREVFVKVNLNVMTLKMFKDKVLTGHFSVQSPDVLVATTGNIIISSDPDDDFSELENRTFQENNIADGAVLEVDDYLQDLKFSAVLFHDENQKDSFVVEQDTGAKPGESPTEEEASEAKRKRKSEGEPSASEGHDEESQAKRMRIAAE
ncbi:unnamed protein product, partial [Mesorhabditis belari]|uniref:SUMO-activating enzyme subunit n=1 Tax=Mesorhabditis belari TaxID=2138241 RepID=A0AAF3F592_9BILA